MVEFPTAHDPSSCVRFSEVLARVGDKWSIQIITKLGEGPPRFSELKRSLDGISQRMLTLTLRGLERDGMISRKVTPSIPPRVAYTLTEVGQFLLEPVRALGEWAIANRGVVDRARMAFDGRSDVV